MDTSVVVEALSKSALFGGLDGADLIAVAARMRQIEFGANQMIFARGDLGKDIYLVMEGRIRLSVLSAEGRELSFAHAGPGQLFGEIAALDGGERTAGATALGVATVMALSRAALIDLVERHPQVAKAAISFLCQRLRDTDQKLEAIALHRIEVRLARLLLSFVRHQSPADVHGRVRLAFPLSQSEIGLLIGASRPKVNLALTALEDMGAISRARNSYACDTAALLSIADGDSA